MLLQNFECHSRSKEFLCAIIHPPCRTRIDQNVNELNYVFDIVNFVQQKTPIPCKSLCNQIGDECLKNLPESHRGGFYDLCNRMPESASEAMCFGGNLSNAGEICIRGEKGCGVGLGGAVGRGRQKCDLVNRQFIFHPLC